MQTRYSLISLILSTACLFSLNAQDANVPDYNQIKRIITDSNSNSYYPTLLSRFNECDTTLTLEDYRTLYYGFALREDYIPYQREDSTVLEVRRKLIDNNIDADYCPQAIQIAQEALNSNPFDLIALSIIPICYLQTGDSTNYKLWDNKLHGILDAINSSGDGETAETAIHIINIEHEYEVFNRLRLELDQVEKINNQTEFIRAKDNPDNIKGLYFNFSACSKVYSIKYR